MQVDRLAGCGAAEPTLCTPALHAAGCPNPDVISLLMARIVSCAHLGDDIGVVGVDARVVKADGGCLDWAAVQLDGAEVEGDARVGGSVLEGVEPCAVAGLVEDIVALNRALQDEARLAPARNTVQDYIRVQQDDLACNMDLIVYEPSGMHSLLSLSPQYCLLHMMLSIACDMRFSPLHAASYSGGDQIILSDLYLREIVAFRSFQ